MKPLLGRSRLPKGPASPPTGMADFVFPRPSIPVSVVPARSVVNFRKVSLLLLIATAFASALPAAEVTFVRIWPAWREATSFERISEYFGGKENTGRQTVVRTQAGQRSGFYFLVRTANPGTAIADARFELKVIKPDSPVARTYTFAAAVPAGSHVFNLGLTGADWPDPETQPVAWQLRLLAADGTELASGKSFLWSK